MDKQTFPSQKVAKAVIQGAIDTNDRAVMKALVMIHRCQTSQEKAAHMTVEANGVGFSAFDADILSSFAEQVKNRGSLTERQMELARKKIRRYWRQLALLSGRLQ